MAEQLGIPDSTKDPDLINFMLFTVTDYAAIGSGANQPVQFFVTDIQNGFKFTEGHGGAKWGFGALSRVRNQPALLQQQPGHVHVQRRVEAPPAGPIS